VVKLRSSLSTLTIAALVAAFWWAAPRPGANLPALRNPQAFVDRVGADRAAVALVAVVVWAVLGWLALGLIAAGAARVPGRLGGWSERLADRMLPATIRRAAALAVGVSVATSAAPAAMAAYSAPVHPAGSARVHVDQQRLMRPGAAAGGAGRSVHHPATKPPATNHPATSHPATSHPATSHPATHRPAPVSGIDWPQQRPPRPATSTTVLVRPGDCLWTIAARRLESGASAARITVAWRAWYVANRTVIGPDPSLIHPGQRLVRPAAVATTSSATAASNAPANAPTGDRETGR